MVLSWKNYHPKGPLMTKLRNIAGSETTSKKCKVIMKHPVTKDEQVAQYVPLSLCLLFYLINVLSTALLFPKDKQKQEGCHVPWWVSSDDGAILYFMLLSFIFDSLPLSPMDVSTDAHVIKTTKDQHKEGGDKEDDGEESEGDELGEEKEDEGRDEEGEVEEELGDEELEGDEGAVTNCNDKEDAGLILGTKEDVNPFLDLAAEEWGLQPL